MFWFVQSTQMVVEYMDGESCYPKHDEARTETEIFDLSLNVSLRKHFGIFGDPSDIQLLSLYCAIFIYSFIYLFPYLFICFIFHYLLHTATS